MLAPNPVSGKGNGTAITGLDSYRPLGLGVLSAFAKSQGQLMVDARTQFEISGRGGMSVGKAANSTYFRVKLGVGIHIIISLPARGWKYGLFNMAPSGKHSSRPQTPASFPPLTLAYLRANRLQKCLLK